MDWSRWGVYSFDSKRRYTSVRLQQGRVETDEDWNEDSGERFRNVCRTICVALTRAPAGQQDWTDHNRSDPGISLLELSAFLASGLVVGTAANWLLHRLSRPTFAVTVDGENWRPVKSLEQAGPDDRVYRIDPETGTIELGDGEHGRKPDGAVNVGPTYRLRGGVACAIGVSWVVSAALVFWLCRRIRSRETVPAV